MKKTFFLIVLCALLSAFSYGQSGTKSNQDAFANVIYVRLGYGLPGGNLKTEEVLTAGAKFEVGTLFYIRSLNLPEKFKIGVDATYLSLTGLVNKDNFINDNQTNSYFTAGLKLGPSISYNFAGSWIADVYLKVHPHYFITGEQNKYDAPTQLKIGYSTGLNVRYKALMIGYELTSSTYTFDVETTPSRAAMETTAKKIKLPVAFLTLGVNL